MTEISRIWGLSTGEVPFSCEKIHGKMKKSFRYPLAKNADLVYNRM